MTCRQRECLGLYYYSTNTIKYVFFHKMNECIFICMTIRLAKFAENNQPELYALQHVPKFVLMSKTSTQIIG